MWHHPRLKKPTDLQNRIKLRELHHGRRRYRPGARNGHRDRGYGHRGHLNVTVQPLPTRVLDFFETTLKYYVYIIHDYQT